MALYYLMSDYVLQAAVDLLTLANGDLYFGEDDTEALTKKRARVIYNGSGASTGGPTAVLLQTLVELPTDIVIAPAYPGFTIGGYKLPGADGYTFFDSAAPGVFSVYDATRCNGSGAYVYGQNGYTIDMPSHILLFHELAHAYLIATKDPSHASGSTTPQAQIAATTKENEARAAFNLPLRSTSNDGGGCGQGDNPPPGGTTGTTCFVTALAWNRTVSPIHRSRDLLLSRSSLVRSLMREVLPEYLAYSTTIVEHMDRSPEFKLLMRDVSDLLQFALHWGLREDLRPPLPASMGRDRAIAMLRSIRTPQDPLCAHLNDLRHIVEDCTVASGISRWLFEGLLPCLELMAGSSMALEEWLWKMPSLVRNGIAGDDGVEALLSPALWVLVSPLIRLS